MAKQSIETTQFLQSAYAENGRYYHDINHIKYLLAKIDEWSDNAGDEYDADELQSIKDDVREAIWWHDVWYSIWDAPGVNESESNYLFNAFVDNGGITHITRESRKRIEAAILATANHLEDLELGPEDIVTKVMLDVDLAAFGADYSLVKYNAERITKEYEPTGASRLNLLEGRVAFLEKLEKRKCIFYTSFFHYTYGIKAIQNIRMSIKDTKDEIDRLKAGLL